MLPRWGIHSLPPQTFTRDIPHSHPRSPLRFHCCHSAGKQSRPSPLGAKKTPILPKSNLLESR